MHLSGLGLLGVVQCAALYEWAAESDDSMMNSQFLDFHVPMPNNTVTPYALSRFSIASAFDRVRANTFEVDQPRSLSLDVENLEKAMENDYIRGIAQFWSFDGVPRDLSGAVASFTKAAADGDADAMFMLGVAYSTGLFGIVEVDPAKASLYYSLASDLGSLRATIAMGHRSLLGLNTPKDKANALKYYRKAGNVLLDELIEFHTNDDTFWYFPRTMRTTYAFGAESSTGLYGQHIYWQRILHQQRSEVPVGSRSAAWTFVSQAFPDHFTSLDDAIDTLTYRADYEEDAKAMYGLARIFSEGLPSGLGQHVPVGISSFDNPTVLRVADGEASTLTQNKLVNHYTRKCVNQLRDPANEGKLVTSRIEIIHSMCLELMAEQYLRGHNENPSKLNYPLAYQLYNLAERKPCATCASGKALCLWREALRQMNANEEENLGGETVSSAAEKFREKARHEVLTNNEVDEAKLLVLFRNALNSTFQIGDITVPFKLAQLELASGEYAMAVQTLRHIVTDNNDRAAPAASLMLAKLRPDDPGTLARYMEGIYALEEVFSPFSFAMRRYEQGDLESATLALLVSSELGIRDAALNLGDLLDTRHSWVGTLLASHFAPTSWLGQIGRALTCWPVPSFVSSAKRVQLAVQQFLLAGARDSVDGLLKAVEHNATMEQDYLPLLRRYNIGMAHWLHGMAEYARGKYAHAMKQFSMAMVSPEAWVPVKFSQFLTVLKLLSTDSSLDQGQNSGFLSWRRVLATYRAIVSVDLLDAGDTDVTGLHVISQDSSSNPSSSSQHKQEGFLEHEGGVELILTLIIISAVTLGWIVVNRWQPLRQFAAQAFQGMANGILHAINRGLRLLSNILRAFVPANQRANLRARGDNANSNNGVAAFLRYVRENNNSRGYALAGNFMHSTPEETARITANVPFMSDENLLLCLEEIEKSLKKSEDLCHDTIDTADLENEEVRRHCRVLIDFIERGLPYYVAMRHEVAQRSGMWEQVLVNEVLDDQIVSPFESGRGAANYTEWNFLHKKVYIAFRRLREAQIETEKMRQNGISANIRRMRTELIQKIRECLETQKSMISLHKERQAARLREQHVT